MKNLILATVFLATGYAYAAKKNLAEQVAGDNAVKMAETNKSRTCEAKKIEQLLTKGPHKSSLRVPVGKYRVWVECNDGATPRYLASVYKVKLGRRWIYKADVSELELK